MDQNTFILSQVAWGAIAAIAACAGVIIPIILYLLKKHKKEMEEKADVKMVNLEFENIQGRISKIERTQDDYAKTQAEILSKVTDIWIFLAGKKSK